MSALNLIPNVNVMLATAGILAPTLWVAKKTILEPYLSVKRRRLDMTVGKHEEAKALIKQSDQMAQDIEKKLKSAMVEAQSIRSEILTRVLTQKEEILAEAEKKAEKLTLQAGQQIASELIKEREKIPKVALELSKEVYSRIID